MAATPNLFDTFFRLVKDTEAPKIYYRWCLVTAIGAFLGRRIHVDMGTFRVFPNHYCMLIGNPGTRKSTAVNSVRSLLWAAGYTTFSATKTRKEKFLLDLEGETPEFTEDPRSRRRTAEKKDSALFMENLFGEAGKDNVEGQEPKEVFVTAPEFNNFLPPGDLEFLSDLGDLWDWDKPDEFFKYRFKNSKSVSIYQPTVSVLGGNTHAGFQQMFPPQAIGQGFLSRLILVHSEPSGKKFPFPPPWPPEIKKEALEILTAIKERVHGIAGIERDAKHALDLIYRSWQDLDDQRFKHYSTRRFTHLLKLALVFAASRVSKNINMHDVLLASSLLSFTEARMPKALGEFGKSRNADAANKVMAALYETRRPMTLPALWKVVASDLEKMQDLSNLLVNLQQADKIQMVKGEGFLPKQKALDRKLLYVDYNILAEYKEM